MQVKISDNSLKIAGQEQLLYGGEFQYFRIPAQLWENSLRLLKEAQLNFISCYIPWIWHKPSADSFDVVGETRPERNLKRVIELIEELDLALLIRPGPYVYGEYQGFGIPYWLREAHPEILMIDEQQTPGEQVSLNHPLFKDAVESWLDEILAFLKPWVDSGRIVACQIDNETGLPQYGGIHTPGDFNLHTISRWQHFLHQRYGDIGALNSAWGTDYLDFDLILPPHTDTARPQHFRIWAGFVEDDLVDYVAWLHGCYRARLPKTFLYTNDPYLNQWPNNSPKKSRHMVVGFDIYSKFTTDRKAIHDAPFALSFAPEYYRSINQDKLLMGVEVGAGWFDPRVDVRPEATLQKSMISLLRGVRVLDYYLLHDCVEEDGIPWIFQSPLDKDGQVTPRYEAVKQVGQFVQDHGAIFAGSEPLYNAVGVLKYIPQSWEFLKYNYGLWNALEVMDQALVHFSGVTSVYGGLVEAGYNPIVHEVEHIPESLLKQLRVVFYGSTPVMEPHIYQKLLRYVEQGGTLVCFGFPVTHSSDGKPIAPNPLFPAQASGSPHRVQFGNNQTLSAMPINLVNYQMLRWNHPHRLSLHTLDMMHPYVEMTRIMGLSGTWLESDRGQPFWSSRFNSFWKGGGTTPVLKDEKGRTVGYTRRIGLGRLIFVGTIPGLFFDTPAYYRIEAHKKKSVLDFGAHLLRERGILPLVEPIPDTEIILRQTQRGGLLVGLVNRGGAKNIELHFNYPFSFHQLETLFQSHREDHLEKARFQHLRGRLSENAVLVVRLYR